MQQFFLFFLYFLSFFVLCGVGVVGPAWHSCRWRRGSGPGVVVIGWRGVSGDVTEWGGAPAWRCRGMPWVDHSGDVVRRQR